MTDSGNGVAVNRLPSLNGNGHTNGHATTNGVAKYHYPFAQGFQRSVVSLMLRDPTFLFELTDVLDASYFEYEYIALVAGIALRHAKKHHEIPSQATVTEKCNRFIERHGLDPGLADQVRQYVAEIYKYDLPSDRKYVQEKVADFGRMRALTQGLQESIEILRDHADDSEKHFEILPLIQRALLKGSGVGTGIEVFTNADNPSRCRSTIADPKRRVATTFSKIDSALRGGLGGGQLGLVLGRTGLGKSSFLVNMAAASSMQGQRVVYITNELPAYDVFVRCLARLTGQAISDVETETDDYKAGARHLRSLGGGTIHIWYVNPGAPVSSVRAVVARSALDDGRGPDVLFVDYADELSPTRQHGTSQKNDTTYMVFGDVYAELISLAHDWSCPVWTASQIQRSRYDRQDSVGMDAVSDSVKKIQKAHIVMSLSQTDIEREQGRMTLFVEKVRSGPDRFKIPLQVDLSRCLIRQRGPEEERSGAAPSPAAAGGGQG